SVSQSVGRRKVLLGRGKNCKTQKSILLHWLVTKNNPKGGSQKKVQNLVPGRVKKVWETLLYSYSLVNLCTFSITLLM
ncbi:hypothetical protein ACPWR0_24045, partial [Pandoraea pneumonica]